MADSQVDRATRVEWLAGAGTALLLGGIFVYVSGMSRTVGVILAVWGVANVFGSALVRRRGAWPSLPWLVAMAVLNVALAAYGVWLLIYVLTRQVIAV